jgi:hypothetical protein
MKQLLVFAAIILASFHSTAQINPKEHLLDGTSFDVQYESGCHEHVEFKDGRMISQWLSGPGQDATGQVSYSSKKIGDKLYVVNFMKTDSHSFVTVIFIFNKNSCCVSAMRGVGRSDEAIFFEEGTLEHLHLMEKQGMSAPASSTNIFLKNHTGPYTL